MRDYSYNGFRPDGAGAAYLVDTFCASDPFDEDCRPTEEVIKAGGRLEMLPNGTAYLIPPCSKEYLDTVLRGGIHFVPEDPA